ncbi:G-protein coupled receptor 4-like [Sparus aurata]|uniref:G-protein coupled receptor 4-like n=1 Tax=Sparus aurata TaxID=8175 RepID=UPI0011C19738|nr:G-protein coupled receptor 4-like [Sparus aurata]
MQVVMTSTIISIGIPLIIIAICSLHSLVRNDHVAPIYVINLLISDLIQLCCLILRLTPLTREIHDTLYFIYFCGLIASVGFMVCVALERFLVIACPLWYRFRRTIKIPVLVCVVVWALTLVNLPIFLVNKEVLPVIHGIIFLLPLPLFIFFLGGTLRALSASRVPSDEKRRIVGILVLVLLIYTLLFLPRAIFYLTDKKEECLYHLSHMCLKLSPIADLLLYVFMRKGSIDKLLASLCCCRMDSNDSSRMDSNITSSTV